MKIENQIKLQQEKTISSAILLGSANYPFPQVLKAKQYPFDLNAAEINIYNRTFPGCSILNEIEEYAQAAAIKFLNLNSDYRALVSFYSGTQANQTVFNTVLEKNDLVLAFSLDCGGHASHIEFIKKYYRLQEYCFENDIDYQQIDNLIKLHKPKLVIAGSSFYPKQIDYSKISKSCFNNGSLLLADISHTALYVAEKIHVKVKDYADFVTFTTHKTTRGIRSAILCYKNIFHDKILFSSSPLTQGAPKYSDILCNALMFEQLEQFNKMNYINSIFALSKCFEKTAQKYNISLWCNNNTSHLVVLKLLKNNYDFEAIKMNLESLNILVNCFLINEYFIIRGGLLLFATLGLSIQDAELIFNVLFDAISSNGKVDISNGKIIKQIMADYNQSYFKRGTYEF